MRKLFILVAAFAAACGGSSGGGGASGTVGGKAFSPADMKAIVAGNGATPCTLPGLGPGGTDVPAGIKAFALQLTSYADACGDFSSGACKLHQNAQTVTVIFARLALPSISSPVPAEPPLTPGTYTIGSSITQPQPEAGGTLYVAFADALATNATCGGTPSPSASGTLRLDEVNGPIKGNVSITFQDGSSLSGDFSAPICSNTPIEVCSLTSSGGALCSGSPSCVP